MVPKEAKIVCIFGKLVMTPMGTMHPPAVGVGDAAGDVPSAAACDAALPPDEERSMLRK